MNREASLELLREMLSIYSPSGKEAELASFVTEELRRLGFERVREDTAGNIYGEIGSGPPSILLCGHMDTVSGRMPVKFEDERLYGRGAVDAKSSLAAMICAASSLKPTAQNGRVVVAGVVEEERNAEGIRQLIREELGVDYAIFGEPSGLGNITFAYRGRIELMITCKTQSGHVGAQLILDNAIEKSFELWTKLKALCGEYISPHGVFYSLTPSLVKARSRRTSGGIPDVCFLSIDLRLPPTFLSEKAVSLVNEVVESFRKENPATSVRLRVTDKVEPFVAKRDTVVMRGLKEAIQEVTGEPAKLIRKTGTGDMNIFGTETGVPVATYGPGDAALSHTQTEYVDISQYLASIRVYKRAVEKILSGEKR